MRLGICSRPIHVVFCTMVLSLWHSPGLAEDQNQSSGNTTAKPAATTNSGKLLNELKRIHKEAALAKGKSRFEEVEKLRTRRLDLLKRTASSGNATSSEADEERLDFFIALTNEPASTIDALIKAANGNTTTQPKIAKKRLEWFIDSLKKAADGGIAMQSIYKDQMDCLVDSLKKAVNGNTATQPQERILWIKKAQELFGQLGKKFWKQLGEDFWKIEAEELWTKVVEGLWENAYRAMVKSESLIQLCMYQEAYDLAESEWENFQKKSVISRDKWESFHENKPSDKDAPMFGDLAMSMARAVECSALLFPERLTLRQDVEKALIQAEKNDPCQVEARVVLAYYTRPDLREAFLRAEVRPSLINRNRILLGLSNDTADGTIMPWHAPVEMLKAESAEHILHDLLSCLFFQEPWCGMDASGVRFQMYTNFMIVEGVDKKNKPGWFYVPLMPRGKSKTWTRYSMYILRWDQRIISKDQPEMLKDQPEMLKADDDLRVIAQQIESMKPLWTKKDEQDAVALYGTGNIDLPRVISKMPRLLLRKNSNALKSSFRYYADDKNLRFVLSINDVLDSNLPSEDFTTALNVGSNIEYDINHQPYFLIIADDAPVTLMANGPEGRRYLHLDDGGLLKIDEDSRHFIRDDGYALWGQAFAWDVLPEPIVKQMANSLSDRTGIPIAEAMKAITTSNYIPTTIRREPSKRGGYWLARRDILINGTRYAQDHVKDSKGIYAPFNYILPSSANGSSFIMCDPNGKQIKERYSSTDWKDLINNIKNVFFKKANAYCPIIPVIKERLRFDELLDKDIKSYFGGVEGLLHSTAQSTDGEAWKIQLPSIWLLKARNEAAAKHYHRALAYYHDVISVLGFRELEQEFFKKVPTPERIEKFKAEMTTYLYGTRSFIIAEVEQSMVLEKAGFVEASEFLKKRTLDRFDLLTMPMLDEAISYAQSYGLSPSGLVSIRGDIELLIKQLRGMVKPNKEQSWIREAMDAKDSADCANSIKTIKSNIQVKSKQSTSEESLVSLIRSVLDKDISFRSWLNLKLFFDQNAPDYFWRSPDVTARQMTINLIPSITYDRDDGFRGKHPLRAELLGEIESWSKKTVDQRNEDESAGLYNFILAWYWLDRGKWHHARNAYSIAAHLYLAGAKRYGIGREAADQKAAINGLTAKLNAMRMMIAASGLAFDTPKGAKTTDATETMELQYQTIMWGRHCTAVGLFEIHGIWERDLLDVRSRWLGKVLRASEDQSKRYYWFDYDDMRTGQRNAGAEQTSAESQADKPELPASFDPRLVPSKQ